MPTYRNDSNETIKVENKDKEIVSVEPNQTVETNKYLSITGLTKTLDTPYYNRVVNRQTITLGAAQDVEISLETDWILIFQITDSVTVYRQSASNTPPEYEDHTSLDPVIQIPAKGTLNNLVMSGTGTCEVVEYKE